MAKIQRSVVLEFLGSTGTKDMYLVTQVTNTTEITVGFPLSKSEVDQLIRGGVKVTIKPRK